MQTLDKKTEQIASELIAKFMAAVEAEDLAEMDRIVSAAASTPNKPLREALMRQLVI